MTRHILSPRTTALAVATLLAIGSVAACTSSGSDAARSAVARSAAGDAASGGRAPQPAAAAPNTSGAAGGAAAKGSAGSASSAGELALTSSKIRTADLTVVVKHGDSVAARADTAEAIALRSGGEVDADDRTSGKNATATLVLRIPPDRLSSVLDELSHLGVERSRTLSTEDVTSKVADVSSRVGSARTAIARLRDLYQHATKIGDVITIESELSDRESDLESLEAQQRSLAAQTATAAVTLSLVSQATPVAKPAAKHHRGGFLGGLRNGWNAFGNGAAALATGLGAVLPFMLLLLALAVPGRLLWLRLRQERQSGRRAPAATPPAT